MKKTLALFAIIIFSALLMCGCKKEETYRLIKVESAGGKTVVERGSKSFDAFAGMNLVSGDKANVGVGASLLLLIDSDKHVQAGENTVFTVNAAGDENNGFVSIDLIEGDALCKIDNKLPENSGFYVKTPNATLSVRGTTFEVRYYPEENITRVAVEEGVVKTEVKAEDSDEIFIEEISAGDALEIRNEEVRELEHIDVPIEKTSAESESSASETTTSATSSVTTPSEESSDTEESSSDETTVGLFMGNSAGNAEPAETQPPVTVTAPPETTVPPVTVTSPPETTTTPVTVTSPPETEPETTTVPPETTEASILGLGGGNGPNGTTVPTFNSYTYIYTTYETNSDGYHVDENGSILYYYYDYYNFYGDVTYDSDNSYYYMTYYDEEYYSYYSLYDYGTTTGDGGRNDKKG